MITSEFKKNVITALKGDRENFGGTDSKHAVSLGINVSVYSRIMKGDTDRVLSDPEWIRLARHLSVSLNDGPEWKTAETPVFTFLWEQFSTCQRHRISGLFCDEADIGKTHTAKQYVRSNKYAVLIDCGQVKSKQKLVREIAKSFGVSHTGRYADVYADLVYYLKTIPNPLVILDEVGDLSYEAFLEIKALWNATEHACAWFMLGADGLKEKMRRGIDGKKVGYSEIFRRFGKRYQRITPQGREDRDRFYKLQAALIIKANAPATDVQKIIRETEGSLTRINTELTKN